jgi:mannose-6-phosphate isomerase-like protein (cupin superfamily)
MDVRRVVTGHDSNGKAVFASDEMVAPITLAAMPGVEFHRLWGSDGPQTYPDAGAQPDAPAYFPSVGGFRFGLFTIPPEQEAVYPEDMEGAMAEIEAKLPGMMAHMELDDPGMHTTDTTDYEIVLSGHVVLELDDGAEVALSPGDTVVQNGTRHRWRNPGTEPAVLGVVLVGAHRS